MIVKNVMSILEDWAPLNYAEDFDNVGLLVGDASAKVTNILITVDTTEQVVDEAIKKKCNLILSFHPIIFSGLKSITGKTYVERVVLKAIQNNIAIYAIHTALDNSHLGVNHFISQQLKLKNTSVLIPQPATLKKLTTYAPTAEAENIRQALFDAGAGALGNYSNCSFNVSGEGSFKAEANSKPTIGTKGQIHYENETMISVVFEKHLQSKLLKKLFDTHSYEEVAYELVSLDNTNQHIGIGMLGELETSLTEAQFLKYLKAQMKTKVIRHSEFTHKPIKKVAVLGGSGSFGISAAKQSGADAYVTADLKYHDFFTAENKILLADIGHYESEQYTKNGLAEYLTKKISNFAIILSNINTNPVNYF